MNSSEQKRKLFLIPTVLAPDTEMRVLTPQILEVIAGLSVFYVENLRTARRFISSLQLGKDISTLSLYELTQKTSVAEITHRMTHSKSDVGILSEAGCPGVADPGAVAVGIAHKLGWQVKPLVGPNSMLLALMASGFSGQHYAFNGYLPIEKDKRAEEIKRLEREALTKRQTQLFMETPYRNNQVMQSLLQHCNAGTHICVAANLTADSEFIETKTVAEWKQAIPELHKIPTIFLIGDVGNNS